MDSVGDVRVEFLAQALKPIEEDIPPVPESTCISTWPGRGGSNE
jgi:hypothetical protein